MKKGLKSIFIMIMVLLLSGCVTEYKRDDIADFVHKETGLKIFKVSSTYKEIMDDKGYTDYLWRIEDDKTKLVFYVLDDHYWGMESVSNYLRTDYDSKRYLKEVNKINNIQNITSNNDRKQDEFDSVELKCYYTNKTELKNCYNSLINIQKHFDNKIKLPCEVVYSFIDKNITIHSITDADTTCNISTLDEKNYEDMLYNYYYFGLSFYKENIINEMTEFEKTSVINNDETYRVCKIDENEQILKIYDNIIGREISYGSLYELLKKENYNVTGDHHHFKVVYGSDTYEFSDYFLDYIYDDNEYGYYYLKNGEKTKNDMYWDNTFSPRQIKEMFGLNITIKKAKELKK